MSKDTAIQADVIHLRQNIQDLLRRRVLEAVQTVLEEELSEALGTVWYERSEARQGYRNGHETRRITTQVGTQALEVPHGPERRVCGGFVVYAARPAYGASRTSCAPPGETSLGAPWWASLRFRQAGGPAGSSMWNTQRVARSRNEGESLAFAPWPKSSQLRAQPRHFYRETP